MGNATRLTGFAILAAVACAIGGRDAAADGSDAETRRAEARELATRGDEAFGAGRCDRAIPLWQEADARFHAPTIVLRIARCEALLGRVVEATAVLEAIVAEALSPDAPEAFASAKAEAATELAQVSPRRATLEIDVDGSAASDAPRVALDDVVSRGNEAIAIDPGPHRVRVTAGDGVWERTLHLDDGETKRVRVRVVTEAVVRTTPPQRRVGWVLGAAGAAAVLTGGVLGYTALRTSSSLDAACGADRSQCPPDRQGDISSLKARALVADLAIGGGGALLAAGGIVLLTVPSAKGEGPRVRVVPVGLGGRVEVRF
jgi:hypothetical protein